MKTISLSALTVLLLCAGCATQHSTLNSSGLPSDKYLVGGGYKIDWIAPCAGTFIIADRTSKKIITTSHLEAGKDVDFAVGEPKDVKQLEALLGLPMKEVFIQAYWVPDASSHAGAEHHSTSHNAHSHDATKHDTK